MKPRSNLWPLATWRMSSWMRTHARWTVQWRRLHCINLRISKIPKKQVSSGRSKLLMFLNTPLTISMISHQWATWATLKVRWPTILRKPVSCRVSPRKPSKRKPLMNPPERGKVESNLNWWKSQSHLPIYSGRRRGLWQSRDRRLKSKRKRKQKKS